MAVSSPKCSRRPHAHAHWNWVVTFFASNLLAQRSDALTQEHMRDLNNWTKSVDASNSKQETTPLWGGPDGDPTLAADQVDHESPPAARKAAARAEHLSKKKQHEQAIEEFKRALALDPQYYEAGKPRAGVRQRRSA